MGLALLASAVRNSVLEPQAGATTKEGKFPFYGLGSAYLIKAVLARTRVDEIQQSTHLPILRSDSAHMLRKDPANCALPETAHKPHTDYREPVEVEVDRSGVPSCKGGTRRARTMLSTSS